MGQRSALWEESCLWRMCFPTLQLQVKADEIQATVCTGNGGGGLFMSVCDLYPCPDNLISASHSDRREGPMCMSKMRITQSNHTHTHAEHKLQHKQQSKCVTCSRCFWMVCHWSFKHICDLYEFWLYSGATLARSLDFDTCSLNHLRNQSLVMWSKYDIRKACIALVIAC